MIPRLRFVVSSIFATLVTVAPTFAQFTQVTGTVTDVNGLPYDCGAITATIVNNNGQQLYLSGQLYSAAPSPVSLGCALKGQVSGSFTMNVGDNTQIKCGNTATGAIVTCATQTQWAFQATIAPGILPPAGTGPQFCNATLTISGTGQNITSSVSHCPALSNILPSTGTPGGVSGDTQCKSGVNFVACTNNANILYASPTGNDGNSGKTWDTAKATLVGALCALPNGNCSSSPKQTGNGTVIFADGVTANPVAGDGLWIGGTADSQFASLPAGWMQAPNPSGNFNLVCATQATYIAHDNKPKCNVFGPNSGNTPLFWLSGTTSPIFVYGMIDQNNTPQWGRIGVDSTGSINSGGTQVASVTLDSVGSQSGNLIAGQGPALTIGNGFWIHIRDSSFKSNLAETGSISAISRTSNVTTVTTSAVCPFIAGDNVSIFQALGDGSFNNTFPVATGCAGGSTFTFSQPGPNASVGAGGVAVSDRAFGIVLYGTQLEIERLHQEGGGGIKFYGGGGNANLEFHDSYMEGGGTGSQPPLWMTASGGGGGNAIATGIYMADTPPNLPTYITDPGGGQLLISNGAGITQISAPSATGGGPGFLASNTIGFTSNYLEMPTDISRRTGGPIAVNFSNGASQNPANWFNTLSGNPNDGYTTASGKRDPFGGTGAIEIDSAGAAVNVGFSIGSSGVAVGDIYLGGTWIRAANAGGTFKFGNPLQFSLPALGVGGNDLCQESTTGQVNGFAPYAGQGNWFWVTIICTIWALPGGAPESVLLTQLDSTHPVQIFRPWLIRVPVGTLSKTEILSEYNSMIAGYSQQAAPGDVAFMPGERLCLPSATVSNEFCGYQVHSNTANRTYTWPDVTGGVTVTIAFGTAVMTTTTITSGACGATVTGTVSGGAAANISAGDVLSISEGTAQPTSPNGLLRLEKWTPAGAAPQFAWCNPTASSQTPAAETINWRAVR